MASFVARQAFGSLRCARNARYSRTIHLTPVVQKKKSQVVIEDLFADDAPVEELIKSDAPAAAPVASTSALNAKSSSSTTTTPTTNPAQTYASKKRRLSPEARLERFNKLSEFVAPRLGRRPAVTIPLVKKTAWVNLVGLAANEEQLTKVTEMFPGWKESGNTFDGTLSELFVRRCEELSCPLLALKVFGNFSKYNLPLTLPGARLLMHSLHVEHPIETVITTSALYNTYNLRPVAQDLASCAMFVAACFKHNSKDSIKVANALVPHLQTMLGKVRPLPVSTNSTEKALNKPNVWIKWALKKVDKALFVRNGQREEWLRDWRMKSGHITEASAF